MPALNFQKQFADAVERGEKRQTIRAIRKDKRLPAKRGAVIALYTGMRTRGCRRLGYAMCENVRPIKITEGVVFCDDGWIRTPEQLEAFARADGFMDWADMLAWFKKTHGLPFSGHLIEWKPPTSVNETDNKDVIE